jgi:hypothetical protein
VVGGQLSSMKQPPTVYLGSIAASLRPAIKNYRKGQPSGWVIAGIISGILLLAFLVLFLCALYRGYRMGGTSKTTDS